MKKFFMVILFMAIIVAFASAWDKVKLEFQPEVKYLNGTMYERVHSALNNGEIYTLSELSWEIRDLFLVGGIVSAGVEDVFTLNLGGWMSVNKGNGWMTDYDWLGDRYENLNIDIADWTHYSYSTIEVDAMILDANVEFDKINGDIFSLNTIFGFRFENWKFTDQLWEILYSVDRVDGFRSWAQEFDGLNGIDYEVNKYIPYLGLNVLFDLGKVEVGSKLTYSPVAYVETVDHHILRSLYFYDYFFYMQVVDAELDFTYNFTRNFSIGSKVSLSHTFGFRGATTVYDEDENEYTGYLGSAGFEDLIIGAIISFKVKF